MSKDEKVPSSPTFRPTRIALEPGVDMGVAVARAHARFLTAMFTDSLAVGCRHFHPYTKAELSTVKSIVECLNSAGSVDIKYPDGSSSSICEG